MSKEEIGIPEEVLMRKIYFLPKVGSNEDQPNRPRPGVGAHELHCIAIRRR